jgi:hypothetical protein
MKTPGTHTDDDSSQQPRQNATPTKKEKSAIDCEDHVGAREKLSEDNHVSKKLPESSRK